MILTYLIVPTLNAWFDRKGPKRFYLVVNLLRAISMIVHAGLFMDVEGGYFVFDHVALRNYAIFGFYLTSYWLVFEIVLNFLRNKPLLYYDRKEGDSGIFDRFFAKYPKLHLSAKIISLIIALICYAIV